MRTDLPGPEWEAIIESATASAWRLEQQPLYASDVATGWPDRWRDGDLTPPDYMVEFADSFLGDYIAAGKTRERIRIVDDPPTWFQEWADWAADVHRSKGERYHRIARAEAAALDIIDDPLVDWWLIDDSTVVLMRFDAAGNMLSVDVDDSAEAVERCKEIRSIVLREVAALR